MERRRKLCFALPSLAGGGAERAAVQILNALDGDRWDRSMFLFDRRGAYLDDLGAGIRLDSAASPSRVARWRALRDFIEHDRPDIVVAFLSFFSVLTASKSARTATRVVFDVQTPVSAFLADHDYSWRRAWNRRLFGAAARLGCKAADLVVATSRGVADDLVDRFGVAADRVRVVHNPVDLATVRAAAADRVAVDLSTWGRPAIVAAGRLADAKNYPLLIDAVAMLRARMGVDLRLHILGQGDCESALRELIAAKRLEGAVTLWGFQRNPWKFIARADVFALTSTYEGFGNVLIEAMACGVPVVATLSPGTREIVTDGVDGVLVEHHETEAVAAALARVLTDESLRARMAAAARIAAERFAAAAIAATYDRLLTELVA